MKAKLPKTATHGNPHKLPKKDDSHFYPTMANEESISLITEEEPKETWLSKIKRFFRI